MSALPGGGGELLLVAPIALAAGALSFASPCVLPLVPGYLGLLGASDSSQTAGRRRLALGAALFVLGFSVVYVTTAIAVQAAGRFLVRWEDPITRIAGVVVIVLGVVFIGGIGVLQRTAKPGWRPRAGIVGAPLLGVVFAVGWTPCVGPTLGLITTMALSSASVPSAVLLAVLYCAGLGVPFVLLALGLGWATRTAGFLRRHVRAMNLAGGGLLVVIGVLMISGLWGDAIGWLGAHVGVDSLI